MRKQPESELKLDPGVPQRRNVSGCKCLLWTSGIFIVLFALFGVIGLVSTIHKGLRAPHSGLYENKTLEEVKDRSSVVRPLIDEGRKFDIIATVWVRTWEGAQVVDQNIDASNSSSTLAEQPIYTGTLFRDVGLKDNHLHADVSLRIPLKGFDTSEELTNHDLRASFVLVPTSPSLLSHMVNYSSWAPKALKFPPYRDWSKLNSERTVLDDAIDSFGISTPLLDFHGVKSLCSSETNEEDSIVDHEQTDDDDNDRLAAEDPSNSVIGFYTTKGKPAIENHPYVVTRTHLRLVDMTKLYNKKAYNRLHNQLKTTGCNWVASLQPTRDWRRCHRDFRARSNAETRFQLSVPAGKNGKTETEWAYAPFMYVTPHSWGPLDLVPMPLHREKCQPSEEFKNLTRGAQFMNATWHISFSIGTPDKVMFGDILSNRNRFNMTDTTYKKVKTQEVIQTLQRVHGHKFSSDSHTGRFVILLFILTIVQFVTYLLQIHYWYTRTTTVGISISGAAFIAISLLVAYPVDILISNYDQNWGLLAWTWAILSSAPSHILLPLAMVKAMCRITVQWWKFVPALKLESPSHRERASTRLDARTSWTMRTTLILGIFVYHYFDSLRDYPLISALGPTPDALSGKIFLYTKLHSSLIAPAAVTGTILQLILNSRSQTFAGQYKSTVLLQCISQFIEITSFIPSLTGRLESRSGFTLVKLLNLVLLSATVYQGVTLPNVSQTAEDDTD